MKHPLLWAVHPGGTWDAAASSAALTQASPRHRGADTAGANGTVGVTAHSYAQVPGANKYRGLGWVLQPSALFCSAVAVSASFKAA